MNTLNFTHKSMTTLLRRTIQQAHSAGLCVVPPRQDGTKAPFPATWKQLQERLSTTAELEYWYSKGLTGIGYITGKVSGSLEAIDFDDAAIYPLFKQACADAGLADLLERVESNYCETTPKGLHLFYRCTEIDNNTKLATRPKQPEMKQHDKDNVQVLIETRGEGGYIIAAPTSGTVHPSGLSYTLISGSVETIAAVSPEERRELLTIARTFHIEDPAKIKAEESKFSSCSGGNGRPGDDFNQRASWPEILTGWTLAYKREGMAYLWKPGKNTGAPSATVGYSGKDWLYVFSTSTVFEAGRIYDKFGAYATLNYNGDIKAAAAALAKLGYGEKPGSEGKEDETPSAAEWQEPTPLPDGLPPVLPLDPEMIPTPFRGWISDIAHRMNLPAAVT